MPIKVWLNIFSNILAIQSSSLKFCHKLSMWWNRFILVFSPNVDVKSPNLKLIVYSNSVKIEWSISCFLLCLLYTQNLPFLSQLAPWTLIFWPPFFECISFEYAWLFLNQWTCSLCLLIFSKRVLLLWYLRYFNTYLCQIVNHSFFANLNFVHYPY